MREWVVGRLTRTVAWIIAVLFVLQAATPLSRSTALSLNHVEDESPVATVVEVFGSVSVIRDHGTDEERIMSPVKQGLWLYRGDQIWTGENSWIEVQFEESARVRVDASSRVIVVAGLLREVDPEDGKERPTLRLLVGRIWVHVADALSRLRNFSVETPSAIAGVRGTIFMVEVGVTGRSVVSVYEGVVAVATPAAPRSEYLVGQQEEVEVLPQQAPTPLRDPESDASRRWLEMQGWIEEQIRWKKLDDRRVVGFDPEPGLGRDLEPGFDGDLDLDVDADRDGDLSVDAGDDGMDREKDEESGFLASLWNFFAKLFGREARAGGSRDGAAQNGGAGGPGGQDGEGPSRTDEGIPLPVPTLPNQPPIGVPMLPRLLGSAEGESDPSDLTPTMGKGSSSHALSPASVGVSSHVTDGGGEVALDTAVAGDPGKSQPGPDLSAPGTSERPGDRPPAEERAGKGGRDSRSGRDEEKPGPDQESPDPSEKGQETSEKNRSPAHPGEYRPGGGPHAGPPGRPDDRPGPPGDRPGQSRADERTANSNPRSDDRPGSSNSPPDDHSGQADARPDDRDGPEKPGAKGGPPAGRGRESAPGLLKRQGESIDGSDGEDAADSGSS